MSRPATSSTLDEAKRRLYDAETALHAAHSSHVDEWIAAAADRLHEALEVYLATVAAAGGKG
jgi:hypothetical protein